jgi:hypothetical protein
MKTANPGIFPHQKSNSPNTLDEIRNQVMDLIEQATGQRQAIIAHALIVDFFDRDHNAAILLNQILYWTARTKDPDGWFYKTYDQWHQELRFSVYQVMRIVRGDNRVLKEKRTLWSIGLETKVCMAPNGRNAVHYRLNIPAFMTAFTEWLAETYDIVFDGKATVHTAQQRTQSDEKKINLFTRYKSAFGNATKQQRRLIWKHQHALGRNRAYQIVADCVGRVRDWNGVSRVLDDAVLELLTRPDKPTVQVKPQPYVFEHQHETTLTPSTRITDTLRGEWQHAANMLRLHMRSDYHALLDTHQLVDHDTGDGETLTIAVTHSQVADTLMGRWSRFVRRYVSDALGREVTLRFVSYERWMRQQE